MTPKHVSFCMELNVVCPFYAGHWVNDKNGFPKKVFHPTDPLACKLGCTPSRVWIADEHNKGCKQIDVAIDCTCDTPPDRMPLVDFLDWMVVATNEGWGRFKMNDYFREWRDKAIHKALLETYSEEL